MRRINHNNRIVGIVANPQSGRDVRRLVAQASVVTAAEKSSMIQRILSSLGSVGVREVVMMPDTGGISARIRHALETGGAHPQHHWPSVRFLEMPVHYDAMDTVRAVEQMLAAGVSVIIVLGGDGTHRVVSKACGSTPLVPLSTGTNNTFPEMVEATVAGLAAGLVALEKVPLAEVSSQNKVLHVDLHDSGHEIALVDLCVCADCWAGTGALWDPKQLRELFVTFASPRAMGLSAIAGYLHPVQRWAPYGLRLSLVAPGEGMFTVAVPLAPGLIREVGVAHLEEMRPKEISALRTCRGTIAFDGERHIEFNGRDRPRVWLDLEGPVTIDVGRVMAKASENHLFCRCQ